ncbi:AAA domain-containing protein [Alicyclobacillus mengziensis]|uniref:AAA family ATPase n=1 Tax=Alicyclobacillus mengziensis TaxID=2931921 RepID=A0A9X7W217_9BACL|nr:AAA domain-containing protein [Alicyclobacillus mengziensis]QSO49194.1 AAA family ATPase [Alicyclobacillus mengziensis]
MNENRYLVLLKGKDKTRDVQSFDRQGQVIVVNFINSPRKYTYIFRDVQILEARSVTDLSNNQVVYQGNVPVPGIRRVVDFGRVVKLIPERRAGKVYDAGDVQVEGNGLRTVEGARVLEYFYSIARYASVSDGIAGTNTFLQQQFAKLKPFTSPRSVLAAYLNRSPVRVEPQTSLDTVFPFRFNLSQREALKNALRSQISIIEGPPGTGKTQTILNILANLVLQDKTVAVVSSNNAAVQNVQDKLNAKGYAFLVAALGNSANRKRFFEALPRADISGWATIESDGNPPLRKQLSQLNRKIEQLMSVERERARLQHQLSAYRLEQEHFEAFYESQNVAETRAPSFFRPTPNRLLSFLAEMRFVEALDKISLLRRLWNLFRYGLISLKSSGRNAEALLFIQRKYYNVKIEQLAAKITVLDNQLSQEDFPSLLSQHQEISERLFRQYLHQKYQTPRPGFGPISYKRQFEQFVNTYPIMLSTTHSLLNCIPENFLFDYVIIDESSQVDLVTASLALSCAQNAIIVGDTKQLSQIVDMRIQTRISTTDQFSGTTYDYFHHNILSSLMSLYGDTLPRTMLREHYRCHPKIIDFCNQKYYDGQLIPFTTENEGDVPLIIYRTAEGNHMSRLSHGNRGRFNQRELDVIEHEVLGRNNTFENLDYTDIGLTTPYRKQVEKAAGQLDTTIEKDTIHKYQGREKRVMILSTVLDSSAAGRKGLEFVNDPCMINVAVSRAQERLILVTDHSMFRTTQSEIGDLLRYMEYNTLDEHIIDSDIVSVFDLLYKDYSDKLRELRRKVRRRSNYDTENIMSALVQEILLDVRYQGLAYREQVFVWNLLRDFSKLTPDEKRYVQNGASVDFVIYRKVDKAPVLVIEVDGFTYHEDNPRQLARDVMKNKIFASYSLPLLRLPTNGSEEQGKIRGKLDEVLVGLQR